MNAPKTLTEAREQLDAANTQLTEVSAKVAAYENSDSLKQAGVSLVVAPDGAIRFEIPRLKEYETRITAFETQVAALEAEKAVLTQSVAEHSTNLSGANKRITELEASQKTVETRAREMVASLGGKPLSIGNDENVLASPADLRTQMNTEKDPNKRFKLYQDLKASEAKNGSHLNGKSK